MNQGRPVYLKLRDRIAAAIIEGKYAEGGMLPSVRVLAAEQGANPLTVAKAYQQFQTDGLVEVQRGVGMYVVKGAAERLRQREKADFLRSEWPDAAAGHCPRRIARERLTLGRAGHFPELITAIFIAKACDWAAALTLWHLNRRSGRGAACVNWGQPRWRSRPRASKVPEAIGRLT